MTDEVGVGKQAGPVGALGEQFSVFAHTQNWPGQCYVTGGKYSVRILRLDFRAGLNKMTEVTMLLRRCFREAGPVVALRSASLKESSICIEGWQESVQRT